ncbi:DNA polymerase IV [invertebrate metagenome]|uniref:DNA-directed DNA polymerase n=1 Tax=invertebrate metagenome TaxID=1711999 RepID=A0A2H9TBA6_9ZZZZ
MTVQRKILHVDADAFYASVEEREDPLLHDRPFAVGGTRRRGVIATCNYHARQIGIHSAMASSHALRLCPQLVIIKPRFDLYRQVSAQMRVIFFRYTHCIEPVSLDEAYLDVSESRACYGSATLMAKELMAAIEKELGITVSVGVAPNKFLAKVASDWNKPNGLKIITPADVSEFVRLLPVKKINGVGPRTAEKLKYLGAITCADLQRIHPEHLVHHFGKMAYQLQQYAQGIDERPVQPDRRRQSISVEKTLDDNIANFSDAIRMVDVLLQELEKRFSGINHEYHPVKRTLKLKFADFSQTSLEEQIEADHLGWYQSAVYHRLLETLWNRHQQAVRLIGVGLTLTDKHREKSRQLSFF